MAVAKKLLADALRPPATERAELAGKLPRSLDEDAEDPKIVEAAWAAEIGRRLREIDSGAVGLLDEDEAGFQSLPSLSRWRVSSSLGHASPTRRQPPR